jgi:Mor family transcriptional regulator
MPGGGVYDRRAMTTNTNPTAKDEDNALLLQGEISDALRAEIGLKDEFAADWGARITAYLRRRLGTQRLYIPAPSTAERDDAIFREYNGSNAGEVCHRYGVSRSRLHQICAEQRAKLLARSPISCLKTGQVSG